MSSVSFAKGLHPVIGIVLVVALATASLAGCGEGGETTTPTTTAPPTTTQPPTTSIQPHDGLPLVSFDSGSFAGSNNCAMCHTGLIDQDGADVSIDSHWRSTMMANAARDPYFRAKVSAEILNAPHLQEVIEDVCATCHTPMAREQAIADSTQTLLFGQGFFNTSNPLHKAGIDGVSCTLCHQIQPDGLGTEESFAGGYVIDTSTNRPNRILFSQFADPDQQIMMGSSGFKPVEGAHLSQSALCATCHTVITPFIDSEGNVQGTFPEQVPFLEWSHSSYAGETQCQSCHMPYAAGSVKTASMPPNLDAKSPFSRHYFVGGNILMLEMLRDNPDELKVTSSTSYFNNTIARALEQLQERTATVAIADSTLEGNTLSVTLNVTNQTGHKLPTGFPSRRVWLHVQILDRDGKVVFESGKPNSDGTITGNRADEEIYAYEPHYDVITAGEQVQIYEAILENMQGDVTHKLLEAAGYAKDNRLLPDGFDKNTAGELIAVSGDALNDSNFIGGSDTVTYRISTAGYSGPFTVKVELLYQPLAYSTIKSILDVDTPEVQAFKDYWEASDKSPSVIDSDTGEIS